MVLYEPRLEKFVFAPNGDAFLKMLARETGGFALLPALSQRDIVSAASGILPACRFQYLLRYTPPDAGGNYLRQKPQVKLVGEAAHKKYTVVTKPPETS
jgi:hypothetical protein